MAHYIDKDATIAEIERIKEMYCYDTKTNASFVAEAVINSITNAINSLEVKEVDFDAEWERYFEHRGEMATVNVKHLAKHFFELGVRVQKKEKYEVPSVSKTEDISVTSRMAMIDDDLKPIAEFILDYAHWNLHKDEWNHPVLEVPLFRVLDALIQKGKPYCTN